MSKKQRVNPVRVKGKGADIFFSDEQAEETEKTEDKEQQSAAVLSLRAYARGQEAARREELATKATFYFTQSQLDALEKAVFLLKQEHRIKTNKSELMRIACEEMVNDFLENRKDSALYQRLAD